MARKDGIPEKQHYVPQLLLREFSFPKRQDWYFHVFDKHSRRQFVSNIKGITAERGFYDLTRDNYTLSFEHNLSTLEEKTSSAFKKLVLHRTLAMLDEEDRAWIGIFLASQHVRVKNFREAIADADNQFCAKLRRMDIDPENVDGFLPLKGEEDLKRFTTYFLIRNMYEFAGAMLHKKTGSPRNY